MSEDKWNQLVDATTKTIERMENQKLALTIANLLELILLLRKELLELKLKLEKK